MQLGVTIVRLMVAQLVHCFEWELPNGIQPCDLDIDEKFGMDKPTAIKTAVVGRHCSRGTERTTVLDQWRATKLFCLSYTMDMLTRNNLVFATKIIQKQKSFSKRNYFHMQQGT
ncbi:hypothetical protein MTR67_019649 [Solanum verrucosum]|uniref:Uncharacterized protein n=1 Tax=Solanum verrucosum TaxID=315347 RepID=A0AAF0QLV8_SOLVR|nr:hypothetical protein MTR67_019649 [Solanum verrucosum]